VIDEFLHYSSSEVGKLLWAFVSVPHNRVINDFVSVGHGMLLSVVAVMSAGIG
jgi:hypothetical protein